MLPTLNKITACTTIMMLLGGCATFMDRNDFEEPRLYPATQMDIGGIRGAITGDSHFYACDSFKILQITTFVVCVIDLPISLCTDTVMLPLDIQTKNKWKGSKKEENNPNQKLDPTVKTPVELGNEQGTAGQL